MDDVRSSDRSNGELAPQACVSCRRNKRKCDKRLPACGLCARLARHCTYTPEVPSTSPSSEEFAALKQQVRDLQTAFASSSPSRAVSSTISVTSSNGSRSNGVDSEDASSQHGQGQPPFPSLFFLDSDAFEYGRFSIQQPSIKVPFGALASLGTSVELREMIERYFSTMHLSFPIISKIRLYQHLADPLHDLDAPLALLFLAMKLVCSDVPARPSAYTQMYRDVKTFYQHVEAANGLDVPTIQALLLIALYEIGHAIYPAAYLTVGNAARVGYATGLHDKDAPQILPRPTTWTEQEERRRMWWAIVVLDRFVNIGHRGKVFATAEPSLEAHLPTDDAAWDRGQMLVAAPLALSSSPSVSASPFARTCQAAHLLGKALRHIDDKSIPASYRFDEALQLHRTMRAFADAVGQDDAPAEYFTSLSIIYSGLLVLYDSYSCTGSNPSGGESQLLMQKKSIDGFQEISDKVARLSGQLQEVIESRDLESVSPMIVDCIYQGAATYAWYYRETSDATCGGRLLELKDLLNTLDQRWKVASEYLCIVGSWQTSSAILHDVRLNYATMTSQDQMEEC